MSQRPGPKINLISVSLIPISESSKFNCILIEGKVNKGTLIQTISNTFCVSDDYANYRKGANNLIRFIDLYIHELRVS